MCEKLPPGTIALKPVDPEEIKKVLESRDEYLLSCTG